MRAFIAIPLAGEARRAVASLQRDLGVAGADVRWTAPDALHVTLKFLGDIDDAGCAGARALLERVAARTPGFTMRLQGAGAFPEAGPPRIVWAGIADGRDEVAGLADAIEREGRLIGWPAEARRFRAHVTIGRVKTARAVGALRRQLDSSEWAGSAAWPVAGVVLYESRLGAERARYTPVATVPLAG
jgi:2'-5' RNA ligase